MTLFTRLFFGSGRLRNCCAAQLGLTAPKAAAIGTSTALGDISFSPVGMPGGRRAVRGATAGARRRAEVLHGRRPMESGSGLWDALWDALWPALRAAGIMAWADSPRCAPHSKTTHGTLLQSRTLCPAVLAGMHVKCLLFALQTENFAAKSLQCVALAMCGVFVTAVDVCFPLKDSTHSCDSRNIERT